MMKRKFGQKVWCHVQVVDPSQSGAEAFDDLQSTLAEIERKKSDLAAAAEERAAAQREEAKPAEEAKPVAAAVAPATVVSVDVSDAAPTAAADEPTNDGTTSDDGVLVTGGEPLEPPVPSNKEGKAPVAAAAAPGPSSVVSVREALAAMGFVDQALVDAVVAKNGDDVEACARDLAVASEWDPLLDDLEEMGFANRELNKSLMLKNDGNMKRTVRDLVES